MRYLVKWVGEVHGTSIVKADSTEEASIKALKGLDTDFEQDYGKPGWEIDDIVPED